MLLAPFRGEGSKVKNYYEEVYWNVMEDFVGNLLQHNREIMLLLMVVLLVFVDVVVVL